MLLSGWHDADAGSNATRLPVVYADHDDGFKSALSRWRPRLVRCTEAPDHSDRPGCQYVVKLRYSDDATAAAISETVSLWLLRAMGLQTLEAVLVVLSPQFAQSLRDVGAVDMPVLPGPHFGTRHVIEAVAGPPTQFDDLQTPSDLVSIWAFDTWVANMDRHHYGNLLLLPASNTTYDLVACDQSDCFGGAQRLASGQLGEVSRWHRPAECSPLTLRAVLDGGGPTAIAGAIERVRRAAETIPEAVGAVPEKWWGHVRADPEAIKRFLRTRGAMLRDVFSRHEWGDLGDVSNIPLIG